MFQRFKSATSKLYGLASLAVFFIGISGIPGDIDQWRRWYMAMIEHPTVEWLAQATVEIAQVVNLWPVRVALMVIGLTMLAWPMRRFWRLRLKIKVWGKRMVKDHVWVSDDEALDYVRQSEWAKLRAPHITEASPLTALANISLHTTRTVSGMSNRERALVKFDIFLRSTLRTFQRNHPAAVRESEGQRETELNTLTEFLDEALAQDVQEEFGGVPNITVS